MAIIKTTDLNVYQNDNLILSDVNIEINAGEFVYLIGKVGTGKSSLLQTLYAELPVKEGEAEIAGFNLNDISEKQIPFLRRKLGIVFQDFKLLSDRNVQQNLEFVLKSTGWKNQTDIDERIIDVLSKVGLEDKAYKMPHQLSGGEQQRVAIARALLNDPEIILADEPTGNLDPDTSEEIIQILLQISTTGRAVLVATHDFIMISKFPSKILVCDHGKVLHQQL
ncbi:MAG: ATP-binding cassette domain-containing protein [Bacteroidales bacterium]|jgi:cell division transport system ATP-binding protein|nr:ATP-binding cassette domain-containing protein [Bacteroidales bacterium]